MDVKVKLEVQKIIDNTALIFTELHNVTYYAIAVYIPWFPIEP